MKDCSFSDLDPGWCLLHACYLSDEAHPHVWENCRDEHCPEHPCDAPTCPHCGMEMNGI